MNAQELREHNILMVFIRKMKEIREGTWALIILILCFTGLFTISMISEGLYGDTDSISHYLLARYAFKYPHFFVYHWGKPLFTTLSAPFAQFGLQGVVLFNILCGLLTAWLVYRIAKELNFRYALAAIPFSLFAPIYLVNLFTSLTEILFALVLVAAIFFFVKQKSIRSSLIISFIPFARTEGMMFLVIFLFAFILAKKYRAVPFLFTGFIIFSLAGYFYYHKFLWFFTAMPYGSQASEIYGSGSFWYYIEQFPVLMGLPLTILGSIGLVYLVARLFKDQKPALSNQWITKYNLITAAFFIFILAHSFLWWQGMMGVIGSKRFMACIMPLGAFLALEGFVFLLRLSGNFTWIKKIPAFIIIGFVICTPFCIYKIPAVLDREYQTMKKTADALIKKGYRENKIIYFDPKLPFFMGVDPFTTDGIKKMLPDSSRADYGLSDSMIVIWDTHFGEFEKKISLAEMLNNPYLQLIDGFVPDQDYKVFQGQNYMSLVFQKSNDPGGTGGWINLDSLDFESFPGNDKIKYYTDTVSFNGNRSYRVDASWAYSPSIRNQLSVFSGLEKVIVRVRTMIYNPGGRVDPNKVKLVLTIENPSGEIYRYISMSGSYFGLTPGKWSGMSLVTPVMTGIPEDGNLKLYVWYSGNEEIYVDDLVLEYIPVQQ
jgi:hypothetical protein